MVMLNFQCYFSSATEGSTNYIVTANSKFLLASSALKFHSQLEYWLTTSAHVYNKYFKQFNLLKMNQDEGHTSASDNKRDVKEIGFVQNTGCGA